MSQWRAINHCGQVLCNVGVLPDGSLHNPNGYPNELVREAVRCADERRAERKRQAIAKGIATRKQRRERRIWSTAQRLVQRAQLGPRNHCVCCGKGLGDAASIERGIGSECWQHVLRAIERIRAGAAA
jgi:hypothetical protein